MTETGNDIVRLRSRVREQADRAEIGDLTARLDLWLDEKRFDEARSIFVEDATVRTPGGTVRGVDSLAEQARRNHRDYDRTQHVTTNVLIDTDGDEAVVRANRVVTFVADAEAAEPSFTIGERCRYEAVRTSRGWRLSRLEGDLLWRTEPPRDSAARG